jgi:hypothetical protein
MDPIIIIISFSPMIDVDRSIPYHRSLVLGLGEYQYGRFLPAAVMSDGGSDVDGYSC